MPLYRVARMNVSVVVNECETTAFCMSHLLQDFFLTCLSGCCGSELKSKALFSQDLGLRIFVLVIALSSLACTHHFSAPHLRDSALVTLGNVNHGLNVADKNGVG